MKFLDEYRDTNMARKLVRQIRQLATRSWVLMDVCGGQTHSLIRYGIERELAGSIELIHGPGCPVCVTTSELVDLAIALSKRPHTILASFGDMLRVPGSRESLAQARAHGATVKIVYSPLDALTLAQRNPDSLIVFFAVGFETTAPSTALAILQAAKLGLQNFSILPAHVRVLPAMRAIMEMPDTRVEGFLAAGHVCSITGFADYESFVSRYRVPVVVTGFEPVDLLQGILKCIEMLEQRFVAVENRYERSVVREGNRNAQTLIDRVYAVGDRDWRGFGKIIDGGFHLRDEYAQFDACKRFASMPTVYLDSVNVLEKVSDPDGRNGPSGALHHRDQTPFPKPSDEQLCRGADVMSGRIKPKQCPYFGTACTPELPIGAPMVSSEGACAAYYRFEPVPFEK